MTDKRNIPYRPNNFGSTNVWGGYNVQGNHFHGNVNIGDPGSHRDETDGFQYLCLLETVDPKDERRRILTAKDKLVPDSFSWILGNETFRSWRYGDTTHLLWIKGGPGKGKTMMMAGLVDVLSEPRNSEDIVALSYFFCQNSETELRTATSIVKGLIYTLVFRQKRLVHHLQKKYRSGRENPFKGSRALITLWNVLEDMLKDFRGSRVYLLVDGLDECDDPEFDDFLHLLSSCNATTQGKVKWLVTSRPHPRIEEIIGPDREMSRISLEIEAKHVSRGVETFINEKVNHLMLKNRWSPETAEKVHYYLQENAEGTFLWVALVCRRLQDFPAWNVEDELTKLASLQRGLDSFYDRMMQVVQDEIADYADLCMRILRTTTLAYRPLRLRELGTVVSLPDKLQEDNPSNFDALRGLIERCGSFILVHEDTIYFVHQSAKDYVSARNGSGNLRLDRLQEHTLIAEHCLDTLILDLKDHQFPDPASLIRQEPGEDELWLLSRIAYASSYWIHHTLESVAQNSFNEDHPNQRKICNLLDSRLIAWVHALGALKEVTACIKMIKTLLDTQGFENTDCFYMMEDTYRFLRHSRHIIEESPNQAYTSALLFAPKTSRIRRAYENYIPKWIKLRTRLNDTWGACLETLLGHSAAVTSLTFSSDGSLLASASSDCTTRLWETETGRSRGILDHHSKVCGLAFSPDGRVLVSGSYRSLKLLDTTGKSQPLSLECHKLQSGKVLFSPDGQTIGALGRKSARLWNVSTGANCGDFEDAYGQRPEDMDFSQDSERIMIAFGSDVEVRDVKTSRVVAEFQEHRTSIFSVQFSPDSRFVLSASNDSIWIWTPAIRKSAKILDGRNRRIHTAEISPDGSLIAATTDETAILWQASTGNRLHVLTFQDHSLYGVVFSSDSKTIVTPLRRGAKSWNTTTGNEIASLEVVGEAYNDAVEVAACSRDGSIFAEVKDHQIRIWETATGALRATLEGHSAQIRDLSFSPAGDLIATASNDNTIKLWNLDKSNSNQATSRGKITAVAISLDGTLAASSSLHGNICLWNMKSGSSRLLSFDSSDGINTLVFSPDNSLLAACSDTTIYIWKTDNGLPCYESKVFNHSTIQELSFSRDSRLLRVNLGINGTQIVENNARAFENVAQPPHEVWTSPDGRFCASLDSSLQTVCLWEKRKDSGDMILKIKLGQASGVATFSPDSKLIAFVSNEKFISVWETETGIRHNVSRNSIHCTSVVSFSHDNRFIAFRLGTKHLLALLELSTGISRILPVAWEGLIALSPDASMIATVSRHAVLVCETMSGILLMEHSRGSSRAMDVVFLPDGNVLVAGYEDGEIMSWDMDNHARCHIFSTGNFIPRLSLDSKRKLLWAGSKAYFFDAWLQPLSEGVAKESSISLYADWVFFNKERVFWLPPDFRPSAWAASGKILIIGHHSGEATFVSLDI